jgi:SulP family sulfate permease
MSATLDAARRPLGRREAVAPAALAGSLVGVARVAATTSIAVLVFAGPLAERLPAAIGLTLVSEVVVLTVVSSLGSLRGAVAGVHPTPAPSAAVIVAAVAGTVAAGGDQRFLTVVLAISLTTVLTGAVFLVVGGLRLSNLVRFTPYPVVAGFLAGTGWLLVRGSLDVMTGAPDLLGDLGTATSWAATSHWLPGVAFGIALVAVSRRFRSPLVLPLGVLVGLLAFYVATFAAGATLGDLERHGWLLGPFPEGPLLGTWTVDALGVADWDAVLAQAPAAAALAAIALLTILLNISGIEVLVRRDADINRELRAAGVANVISGAAGGMVGFHTLAHTSLSHRLGAPSRLVPWVAAVVPLAVLVAGTAVIALLPRPVLGGLLLFVGATFLIEWLVESRSRLPAWEYVVIGVIVLAMAVLGPLEGVAVGLVLALASFVVAYSRIDVVRHAMDGASYHSSFERPEPERELLQRRGHEREYWQLQGFVFFGTADALVQRATARADDASRPLRFLVIDFGRVTGIDSSAALSIAAMQRLAADRDFILVLASLRPTAHERLAAAGVDESDPHTRVFADLERAVQWCEDRTLGDAAGAAAAGLRSVPLEQTLGDAAHGRKLLRYVDRLVISPGDVLVRRGDMTDDVYFVESGILTAEVVAESGATLRIRKMGPGALIGEVALFTRKPRTASVVAESPCTLHRLSRSALEQLVREDPETAARLQSWFAERMADRLSDNLRIVRALLH